MALEYREPRQLSPEEVEAAFTSGHPHEIIDALWSLALYGEDVDVAENAVRRFITCENSDVREIAVRAEGAIARTSGRLSDDIVAAVRGLLSDTAMRGAASDTLSDYEIFTAE